MSIKNNTASLQDLLEQVNALPEAENLDAEIVTQESLLSEQDAKIAELAEVLAGKVGGGGSEIVFAYIGGNTNDKAYIIPFTEGMTWAEFIASDYNIRYIYGSLSPTQTTLTQTTLLIENPNGNPGFTHSKYFIPVDGTTGKKQTLNDVIIAGKTYKMYDDD